MSTNARLALFCDARSWLSCSNSFIKMNKSLNKMNKSLSHFVHCICWINQMTRSFW